MIDNEQFQFGQALKVDAGFFGNFMEGLKMFALTKLKGYDLKKISVVTLLLEGDKEEVETQEELIHEIAKKYFGVNAGESNGKKGYVSSNFKDLKNVENSFTNLDLKKDKRKIFFFKFRFF